MMASFGDLHASINRFKSQATNALVDINFEVNFSKKIIPPPPEYLEIGQNLAASRRHEAQEGDRHILARRLGLLFKNKEQLPSSPHLIKAYGTRASEISRSSSANPQGNSSHGPFADIIGADGTTLWAAATSGRSAIQCHLLACLLARIWEAPEATSIWAEIIARRKDELRVQFSEQGELDSEVLFVMAEDCPRPHLRDWDSSARAWLRVADTVMAKRQTQLHLIVDNMHLPVNLKPDTYDSVMDAWASAMAQMERLLEGAPLQVCNGDILLGLLSWHLYPDMRYLSRKDQEVKQRDPLLEGRGILSLGLEPSPRMTRDRQAVFWSLPLAHLRFYGRLPVTRTRSIRMTDRDRITAHEMLWAMLSAYVLPWNDGEIPSKDLLQYVSDVTIELHWACGFEDKLSGKADDSNAYQTHSKKSPNSWMARTHGQAQDSWLTMLSRIALMYRDLLEDERVRKIRNMGQRFCLDFHQPFQSIFNTETFLMAARNLEDKINLLREIASSICSNSRERKDYDFIITYKKEYLDPAQGSSWGFEYATARPEHGFTMLGVEARGPRLHRRWIGLPYPKDNSTKDRLEEIRALGEAAEYSATPFPAFRRAPVVDESSKNEDHRHRSRTNVRDGTRVTIHSTRPRSKRTEWDEFGGIKVTFGQDVQKYYTALCGDLDSVALLGRPRDFRPIIHQNLPISSEEQIEPQYRLSPRDIMRLFRPGSVRFTQCAKLLTSNAPEQNALLGLTAVESLYGTMSNATVDVKTVQTGLSKAQWVASAISRKASHGRDFKGAIVHRNNIPKLNCQDMSIPECFACIAMLETGTYNLDPMELENVFALCSSDSLYIASALLQDPAKNTTKEKIRRFTGNIGRAGMALFVPPKDPEIRSYDKIEEWYQYDHKEFDGTMSDCFEGTSLHLSFSEASQAVNVEFFGGRDVEAYFLEALISVYDRDTWIAELDILKALTSHRLVRRFLDSKPCQCRPPQSRGTKVVSIDNYAEMLTSTNSPGIIRAQGNWQARLVAASLCMAKGCRVVLRAHDTCWGCLSGLSVEGVSMDSLLNGKDGAVVIL